MKKLRAVFVAILLLSLCALALTGCNATLDTPAGLWLDIETQTLRWNPVKGARFYTIQISGQAQEIATKENSISLEDLKAGDYEIRIKANSDGKAYDDSAWVTYSFHRVAETGLKYQLINNDTAYQLVSVGTAEGDVVMEDTFRGKPVVSIADKALYGSTKITSFTVGNNVTSIGSKAFAKCAKLTAVVIPEGVTQIGEYAFQSCKSLTSIVMPDSITQIPSHLFAWCDQLTNVTLGQYITGIGNYAFSNCESLVSVTFAGSGADYKASLPGTVESIGNYAFADCYALTDMNLGGNVVVIGQYAFANCQSLTRVDLGQKLEAISDYAFSYCIALPAVSVPDTTVLLSENTFRGCAQLSQVSLGSGLRSIGSNAFKDTAILNGADKMLIIDGWLIQYLDTEADKLTISENVYGIADRAVMNADALAQVTLKGVKYVGAYAFYRCDELYRVTTDDALIELGALAFAECPYLKNVTLGSNLETIGNYAFAQCETLASVEIPDSVTSIGTRAFRDTKAYADVSSGVVYMGKWAVDYISSGGMASIVMVDGTKGIANYAFSGAEAIFAMMPASVEYIGRGAFYNCGKIYSISLPASLKYIGDYAFYGCGYANFGGNTYELVIPEGTEYIGRSAFYACWTVLSISVPGSVKTIGDYAFFGCEAVGSTVDLNLETGETDESGNPIYALTPYTGYLRLAEGIESIGERAFQGCVALREVTIPNSVTYLGSRAFYKCGALEKVTLGTGVTQVLPYTFYKCAALQTVQGTAHLQSIDDYAFCGCEALNAMDLQKVQTLGRYAFYKCGGMTQLTLGNQLRHIGDYAFRGCSGITGFTLPASVAYIGKHSFYGLNGTTLYCQAAAIPEQWNQHFNSSFRPVFLGCTLSEDGQYVLSVTVGPDALRNSKATGGISDPVRAGYTFGGWTTQQGSTTADYTAANVAEAPAGTVLYAIWTPEG